MAFRDRIIRDARGLARLVAGAAAFRISPFSVRNGVLLFVSVFDVLLYVAALSVVLSTIFSLGGLDRFILMFLGLMILRWSLGCAVQASRLAAFGAVCRPFLRYPILSTAILAMGYPTIVFALSWGLMVAILGATGAGDSSPARMLAWGLFAVGVQGSWNLLLVLAVIFARTRRWLVSEVPIFLGFALFLIISPVLFQFRDLPFTANQILTSFNPLSHLIAAYHNALWYGVDPSLEVLPWSLLLAIVGASAVLRFGFRSRRPALPEQIDGMHAPPETLIYRSGLWLHDGEEPAADAAVTYRPWRGELPWMTGRELLRLLFLDRDDAARAADVFQELSPGDGENVTLDLPLPVFPDRILDRLCCAAALARRDEAAILDRLLDLMEPDDIVNFHRTTRRRRDEPVPPLRVRARPEVAQHLIRARA